MSSEIRKIDARVAAGELRQKTEREISEEIRSHVIQLGGTGGSYEELGDHWKQLYLCLVWVFIWVARNNRLPNYSTEAFLYQYGNPYVPECMRNCVQILQHNGQTEAGNRLHEYFCSRTYDSTFS